MSYYVGVDLSTHFVDLVRLDEDSDRAEWVRVPLTGETAVDRARSYRQKYLETFETLLNGGVRPTGSPISFVPASWWWDDVILCALEDPAGRGDTRKIARVQGVVLATIPARVHCWVIAPQEWKKAVGLPGNCGKDTVREWTCVKWHAWLEDEPIHAEAVAAYADVPQDACDAYCIAYAARAINETQEEAA